MRILWGLFKFVKLVSWMFPEGEMFPFWDVNVNELGEIKESRFLYSLVWERCCVNLFLFVLRWGRPKRRVALKLTIFPDGFLFLIPCSGESGWWWVCFDAAFLVASSFLYDVLFCQGVAVGTTILQSLFAYRILPTTFAAATRCWLACVWPEQPSRGSVCSGTIPMSILGSSPCTYC